MHSKARTLPQLALSKLRLPLFAAALAAGVALAACAPTRAVSGYQAIEHQPADVKVGMDTKSTVLDLLGSPSAQSTFDPNTWYYVTQISAQIGYHKPRVTRRSIVAISFDKESEKVTKVDSYSLKDGKSLAFNDRETPTRGREVSWLEQLVGTVGRGGVLPQDQSIPGQRPGGGQ
jgi:outer membrane protein assembly factor BamE (lipoprotein component of BamABCDE complex)